VPVIGWVLARARRHKVKLIAFAVGFAAALLFIGFVAISVVHTSSPEFCMACHEMRVVGEQGWMYSKHYQNPAGVVAGCSDCHVPPALFPMLWVKTRSGLHDVWVHLFGESDPARMDWARLGRIARSRIQDASCLRCHQNLTPTGASIKTLIAHRENERMTNKKTCLECHPEEFHGRFKTVLPLPRPAQASGGLE
jgi:nitrate/TMAO reductase-like tetraheme cytochrome c subunit